MKTKIVIALGVVLFGANAFAASTKLCAGDVAATAKGVVVDFPTALVGDALFVKKSFKLACSPNVMLYVDGDASKVWAAAGSAKGSSIYLGNTEGGGGVRPVSGFTPAGKYVVESEVSGKMTDAQALSGS